VTAGSAWSLRRRLLLAGPLRSGGLERRDDVAQRSVEIMIGRLITDEAFRMAFFDDPAMTLTRFMEAGYDLTALETAALRATGPGVWAQAAEHIDPRLQKVSFATGVDDKDGLR
jgi:hypothetical protein